MGNQKYIIVFLFIASLFLSNIAYAFKRGVSIDYDKITRERLEELVKITTDISRNQQEMIDIFSQNKNLWLKISQEMEKRNKLLLQKFQNKNSLNSPNEIKSNKDIKNLIAINKEQLIEQRKTMLLLQRLLGNLEFQK